MRDVTMLSTLMTEDEEREIDLDSVVLSFGTSYLAAYRSDFRRSPARR